LSFALDWFFVALWEKSIFRTHIMFQVPVIRIHFNYTTCSSNWTSKPCFVHLSFYHFPFLFLLLFQKFSLFFSICCLLAIFILES
jgi:hypothetical protein